MSESENMRVKKMNYLLLIAILPVVLLLSGCHKNNKAKKEAVDYIHRVEQMDQAKKPEAEKKEKSASTYVFESDKGRNPFEAGESSVTQNKKNYANTLLPTVSIDNMKLIGTAVRQENSWAIVRASDGKLYRVVKGVRLGVQQALVSDIRPYELILRIEAESGSKEAPRDVTLRVQE